MTFKSKLLLFMILGALVPISLLTGIAAYQMIKLSKVSLQSQKSALISEYDSLVKTQVNSVISILKHYEERVLSGDLSREEAKIEGANLVRNLRYSKDGYFWVDTIDGTNVVLLGKPAEGKNRINLQDVKGKYFIREIIEHGRQEGGGYTDYWFPKADGNTPLQKRGYSLEFKPWGWVVGTGNYIDDINRQIEDYEKNFLHKYNTYIIVFTSTAIFIILICLSSGFWMVVRRTADLEKEIVERKLAETSLLSLKDDLQAQNRELQLTEISLREQNDRLLATEEMLRVQVEESDKMLTLLKESEERFKALHYASFGGVIIHDKGLILDCNQSLSEITGFTNEELIGMDGLKLIAPDSRNQVIQNIQSGHEKAYEVEGLRKDGSKYPLAIRGKNIPYKGGTARVIEFRDISERKNAEEALRASEALYRLLTEDISDVVWKLDCEYRLTYISPADERMRGYQADEVIGHHVFDLFTEEGLEVIKRVTQKRQEDEEKGIQTGPVTFQVQQKCKDGSVIWTEVVSTPERDEQGTTIGFHGITRDITERIEREKEQLKIGKLESLGILAGGIAHDFNNILTGIMGNVSTAQRILDPEHKAYKLVSAAENACVRAAGLSHQLLTFAKGGEPIKKKVSLQHLVGEAVSLILHGSNVLGIVDIPETVHTIEADGGQLTQILHNLIINATQAMPEGGSITIAARNETLDNDNVFALPQGPYVSLTISDQGCGVSEVDLKKIFDPYFTTKSSGNGLGLATVNSIIRKHGGHVSVTSVVGKGTVFSILLPSIGSIAPDCPECSVTQLIDEHIGGSVLVLDDEELILGVTTEMLEHLGYGVSSCKNGDEAVFQYKTAMVKGTPFSAVIMDLTIPGGLGGKEAAQQILVMDPDACLIVSSGYSNDPIMADYNSFGFAGSVTKPYTVSQFSEALNSALKKPSA